MKTLIAAGAVALLAASSVAVLAAEATGMISSIDATAGTVTLDDGKVYKLPTTVALADFKIGQKVMIMFEGSAGTLSASAISLAPAAGGATPAPGAPSPSGGNAGPTNNPGAPRD
jgi:hypothetical protein